MNNPSKFADKQSHLAMDAAREAEMKAAEDKIARISRELYDFHLVLMRRERIRPQQGIIAAIEMTAQGMVTASLMSATPAETLHHYVEYLENIVNAMVKATNESPFASIIQSLYKEPNKCSSESSSAEPPLSSATKPSECSSSSSGESK